ncbi:hypothetical protein BGX34_001480 [Mortierella sp. NVP85]|nr:hypothetical protein BGX34_001480 [Mortierella sp. NVP85]
MRTFKAARKTTSINGWKATKDPQKAVLMNQKSLLKLWIPSISESRSKYAITSIEPDIDEAEVDGPDLGQSIYKAHGIPLLSSPLDRLKTQLSLYSQKVQEDQRGDGVHE